MKCIDVHNHLVESAPFVDWNKTTDSFKIGDPERELHTLATVWKPTFDALREAHSKGAELVVAHESLFVKGWIGGEEELALPSELEKLQWLREVGLAVYRCHDVWDRFPEIGIREGWQKQLRFGGRIIADQFPLLVTEIEPRTVESLARHVLEVIRPLGQTAIQICGDPGAIVSRVATGTGVTPDPMGQWNLGADVGIMTDDYFLHCRDGAHAMEQNYPMIFVNHGVTEEWGIEELSRWLAGAFPELNVFHIPQKCPYQTIV